jgi:hypothetical protein
MADPRQEPFRKVGKAISGRSLGMKAAMAKIATSLAGAVLLGGCVSMHDHRGTVIDTELVSAIQPGVDNKTPTLGRKSSIFSDIFGNIGTVNSAGMPGGGGRPY